jgi:hypothetical protein
MGNTITFNVNSGEKIPPRSAQKFELNNDISDGFLAKIKTISGNISNSVVRYDFRNEKWISSMAGLKEVIEYYTDGSK